jgi:phosphoserine phosphatase RsbU/P
MTKKAVSSATQLTKHEIKVLLIDDQAIIGKSVEKLLEKEEDISFFFCQDPTKALELAKELQPTVILQDLVMPELDGLTLLKYFRAFEETKEIPMIVLSSKEEPIIKAEAFELGANDYLVKLPDKIELIARIRYHSKGYINLLEKKEAYKKLLESQQHLQQELNEAADYVCSLLPDPLEGKIQTKWEFIPCSSLGGDAFGYHWIDENHLSIYLLDVCGHGVGAALLSISALNSLRSSSLNNVDFLSPKSVLEGLNRTFKMEEQNQMFFTMWYCVYNVKERTLKHSSGGHPPALLFTGKDIESAQCLQLKTPGLVIGAMPDEEYYEEEVSLDAYAKLYLYSDGVFELFRPDGTMITFDEYVQFYLDNASKKQFGVDTICEYAQNVQNGEAFEDDVSILEVTF